MKFHAKRIDGEYTIFKTIQCPRWLGGCSSTQEIKVRTSDLNRYNRGVLMQDAFPYLDAGQRERLISGICSICWDKMMMPDDEEEEF